MTTARGTYRYHEKICRNYILLPLAIPDLLKLVSGTLSGMPDPTSQPVFKWLLAETYLGYLVVPVVRLPIHRSSKERLGNHKADVGVVRIQLVRP